MTTTAEYRERARILEIQLQWGEAAEAWDNAITHHPRSGPLATLDKTKMAQRRDACRATHNQEVNERAHQAQ